MARSTAWQLTDSLSHMLNFNIWSWFDDIIFDLCAIITAFVDWTKRWIEQSPKSKFAYPGTWAVLFIRLQVSANIAQFSNSNYDSETPSVELLISALKSEVWLTNKAEHRQMLIAIDKLLPAHIHHSLLFEDVYKDKESRNRALNNNRKRLQRWQTIDCARGSQRYALI